MPTRFVYNFPVINPAHTAVHRILTGHYHSAGGYRTVRDRGTKDWLIIHTINGSGRFANGHGVFLTQPGDVVILAPGVHHDYGTADAGGSWDFLWAHFVPWPHWTDLLDLPGIHEELRFLRLGKGKAKKEVENHLRRMNRYGSQRSPHAVLAAMNALEAALLICDSVNLQPKRHLYDARIFIATEFLSRNFAESVTLQQTAKASGLSVSRLSYLFVKQVGMTPMRFLEQQRLLHAMELLRQTPLNVTQIAFKVGFSSQPYFSRVFARYVGKSPRQFRKS